MTLKKLIILGAVKLLLIGLAVGVVFAIYGCSTVRGVGQDVEQTCETVQRSTR